MAQYYDFNSSHFFVKKFMGSKQCETNFWSSSIIKKSVLDPFALIYNCDMFPNVPFNTGFWLLPIAVR